MAANLVQILTCDSLYLHGFYSKCEGKAAVLHIHGYEGNFYENFFLQPLYKKLQEESISFLSANTRGNGKVTDINLKDGNIKTIGAWNENLNEAFIDIDAWVKFLVDEGFETIILEGHSLGTRKATRYLFEGKYKEYIKKLILLSPFDALGNLKENAAKLPNLLDKARKEILNGNGTSNANVSPWIGMSYATFVSWYEDNDYNRVFEFSNPSYDFTLLKKIAIPTLVIAGEKDTYFYPSDPRNPEEAYEILKKNLPNNKTLLFKDSDHWFHGHEDMLSSEILHFTLDK